jgi:hypothetical protein
MFNCLYTINKLLIILKFFINKIYITQNIYYQNMGILPHHLFFKYVI